MKSLISNRFVAICIAASAFSMSGCDLLKEADDVNFNTTLEGQFEIRENNELTNAIYSQTITLDATSDADINRYKKNIKGFKVKRATYKVWTYSGDETSLFSGTLSFGDASQSTGSIAVAITNLDLRDSYLSGSEFELPINQSDIDKIGAMLKDDKAVKVYLNGTLSPTPVIADIKVFLECTVEASVL